MKTLPHGRTFECSKNLLLTFNPFWACGQKWRPYFGDRNTLLILRRKMPKEVSFQRAYTGWRCSGANEERELGEGRAFLRWLQKHQLSISWSEKDFTLHPLFSHPLAPAHEKNDEMAENLSFAIRPVRVAERNIKLYVQDVDMLSLLQMPYGQEKDFLYLVGKYIQERFKWETWRAPAPSFLDWVIAQACRPLFAPGQLGFRPHL